MKFRMVQNKFKLSIRSSKGVQSELCVCMEYKKLYSKLKCPFKVIFNLVFSLITKTKCPLQQRRASSI